METKQCPYCGEEILAVAKKCKHCGEWLTEKQESESTVEPASGFTEVKQKRRRRCPFCAEMIESGLKVCPQCKESLVKKQVPKQTQYVETSETITLKELFLETRLASLLCAGFGWILFFFGGWHLVLGEKPSKLDQFLHFLGTGRIKQDFIWDENCIAIRINESFWGFATNDRFFDAPFIQWLMLGFALGAFYYALKILIFGND